MSLRDLIRMVALTARNLEGVLADQEPQEEINFQEKEHNKALHALESYLMDRGLIID